MCECLCHDLLRTGTLGSTLIFLPLLIPMTNGDFRRKRIVLSRLLRVLFGRDPNESLGQRGFFRLRSFTLCSPRGSLSYFCWYKGQR